MPEPDLPELRRQAAAALLALQATRRALHAAVVGGEPVKAQVAAHVDAEDAAIAALRRLQAAGLDVIPLLLRRVETDELDMAAHVVEPP